MPSNSSNSRPSGASSTSNQLNFDQEEIVALASSVRNSSPNAGSSSTAPVNEEANQFGLGRRAAFTLNNFFSDRYKKYVEKLRENAPKILLVGDSGLGKSSLVNIVFSLKLGEEGAAQVDHGVPCTSDFVMYGPTDHAPVRIIDSKGLEKKTATSQLTEIQQYIAGLAASENELDHVHLVYYFVADRWQEGDIENVKALQEYCSVILIINKCDTRREEQIARIRKSITESFPTIDIAQCADPRGGYGWIPKDCKYKHGRRYLDVNFDVCKWTCNFVLGHDDKGEELTCDEYGDDEPYGHSELVQMSTSKLPDLLKQSFRSAQKADMTEKHRNAAMIIGTATMFAGGVGAQPLPFADFPILIAIETGMATGLMMAYGMPLETLNSQMLVRLSFGTVGIVGMVGYGIAQVFKLIPGFGTLAGAAIDTTVASTVVLTLGISIAIALANLKKEGILDGIMDVKSLADMIESISKALTLETLFGMLRSGSTSEQELTAEISKTIEESLSAREKTSAREGQSRAVE